jgi:hypothetical protein
VHVGVKEPVAHGLAQEVLDHGPTKLRQIETLGDQRAAIRQRRAIDPFEREHVLAGQVPIHDRHAEVGIILGVVCHLGHGGGFQPQVHLDGDGPGERVDHFGEPQPARLGGEFLSQPRRKEERVEIDLETPFDPRAQHLDGDGLAAVGHDRAMHLRDRRRGNRRSERREQLADRLADVAFDHAFRLGLRKWRHLVLQVLKIECQCGADHVGPCRQKLSELHIARAERAERARQTVGARRTRALEQTGDAQRALRRQRQQYGID